MVIQAFYNGVTQSLKPTIDVAARGTLLSMTEDEAYNLIEEMALNNFQRSTYRTKPKQVGCKLKADVIALISPKVDAITHTLGQMNVNAMNSSALSSCKICGSI